MKTKTVSRTETIKDYKELKRRCSAMVREIGLLAAAKQYRYFSDHSHVRPPFPEAKREDVLHEIRAAILARLGRLEEEMNEKKISPDGNLVQLIQNLLQ